MHKFLPKMLLRRESSPDNIAGQQQGAAFSQFGYTATIGPVILQESIWVPNMLKFWPEMLLYRNTMSRNITGKHQGATYAQFLNVLVLLHRGDRPKNTNSYREALGCHICSIFGPKFCIYYIAIPRHYVQYQSLHAQLLHRDTRPNKTNHYMKALGRHICSIFGAQFWSKIL